MARKLLITLWRYLETGLIPHGAKLDAIACTTLRERTRKTYRDPRWMRDRAHRVAETRRDRDGSHSPWSPKPSQCCEDLGAGNPGPDMSWCGECRTQRGLALDQLESFPSARRRKIGRPALARAPSLRHSRSREQLRAPGATGVGSHFQYPLCGWGCLRDRRRGIIRAKAHGGGHG
jgi:hypothetical protein